MNEARANLQNLIPRYKSKAEEDWSVFGPMFLYDEFDERVQIMHYEPVTFNIPGGQYKPDFLAILQSGRVVIIEVKASKKQRNYRDARSKLRAAASLFPFFTFVEAIGVFDKRDKSYVTWELEVV